MTPPDPVTGKEGPSGFHGWLQIHSGHSIKIDYESFGEKSHTLFCKCVDCDSKDYFPFTT